MSKRKNILYFVFRSSAFFVFCSEHRPRIKEENPGISIGDIAKKLGELWAQQSLKDKAPYASKAAKLKEKYEKVSTRLVMFKLNHSETYIRALGTNCWGGGDHSEMDS